MTVDLLGPAAVRAPLHLLHLLKLRGLKLLEFGLLRLLQEDRHLLRHGAGIGLRF